MNLLGSFSCRRPSAPAAAPSGRGAGRGFVRARRIAILGLGVAGLMLAPAAAVPAEGFAPRLFPQEGLPAGAGDFAGGWAQLDHGAWAVVGRGVAVVQEGAGWRRIALPDGHPVIGTVAHPLGAVLLSPHSVWLEVAGELRPLLPEGEFSRGLRVGDAVIVQGSSGLYRIDRDGGTAPLPPPEEGTILSAGARGAELRRIGGTSYLLLPEAGKIYTLRADGGLVRAFASHRRDLRREPLPRWLPAGVEATEGVFWDPNGRWPEELTWQSRRPDAGFLAAGADPRPLALVPREGVRAERELVVGEGAALRAYATPSGTATWSAHAGIPNEQILDLRPAPDGLWVGGRSTLYFVPEPSTVTFAPPPPAPILEVMPARAGPVYLTAAGGFRPGVTTDLLGGEAVRGAIELSSGEQVIAGPENVHWGTATVASPAFRGPGRVRLFELSPDRVLVLNAGKPSELWTVERDGATRWWEVGRPISSVAVDRPGRRLLAGTDEGASVYDLDGAELPRIGTGATTVWRDGERALVFDTSRRLYDAQGNPLATLPFAELRAMTRWRGELYATGRLLTGDWVTARLDPVSGAIDPLDLPVGPVPVSLDVQGDALLLASDEGLVRLAAPRFSPEPGLNLRLAQADGRPLRNLQLPSGTAALALIFPAPRPQPWPTTRYRYRLDGGAWQIAAAGAVVELPRLPWGRSRLEVEGMLPGRLAATTLTIERAYPWALSWPGWIAGVGMLIGGIMLTIRISTRALHRRNAALVRDAARRTDELRRASAAKDEFIESMDHEIRNPVNGIVGLTHLLGDHVQDPRGRIYIQSLEACTEQLRATMNDVLDFARLEKRELGLSEEVFDLVPLLHTTCRREFEGVEAVAIEGPLPEACWCEGDQGKIRLILGNYLGNALKYGVPRQAWVTLGVDESNPGSRWLNLRVSNHGPTLSGDEMATLFNAFVRGSRARATGARGTGLGLAMCRRYAEAMGGEVGVESRAGTTTFWLRVPVRRAQPVPVVELAPVPGGVRVLGIEDEAYNRLILTHYLKQLQVVVDWAGTSDEAISLARVNTYDVILTDCMLPDAQDTDIVDRLRTLLGSRLPPVVVVSAAASADLRERLLASGAKVFLSKPLNPAMLHRTLSQLRLVPSISPAAGVAPAAVADPVVDAARLIAPSGDGVPHLNFEALLRLGGGADLVKRYAADLESTLVEVEGIWRTDPALAGRLLHKLRSATLLVGSPHTITLLREAEAILADRGPVAEVLPVMKAIRRDLESITTAARALSTVESLALP